MMDPARDITSRRRRTLDPLQTLMSPQHHHNFTPSSVGSVPYLNYTPSANTPLSVAREYNPQQWRGSRLSIAGEEVPPPYSPPRANRRAVIPHRNHPGDITIPTRPDDERDVPLIFASLSPELNRVTGSNIQWRNPGSDNSVVDRGQGVQSVPPGARRAASTGMIDATAHLSRARASSSTSTVWPLGLPMPPPPPGPPPQNALRSQSLTRMTPAGDLQPTRRPRPTTTLGPVPPTPAGWVNSSSTMRRPSPHPALQIDTSGTTLNSVTDPSFDSGGFSSSSGLSRAKAIRGDSKSIRERRSESRSGKSVNLSDTSSPPSIEAITPSDITVPPSTILGRRSIVTKDTSRSGRLSGTPQSSRSLGTPNTPETIDSRTSTPRALSSIFHRRHAETPPFSPDSCNATTFRGSPVMSLLPTPPPQPRHIRLSPTHNKHSRSIIEALIPSQQSPLRFDISSTKSPSVAQTRLSTPIVTSVPNTKKFGDDANSRHALFIEQEISATTDEERVRIFTEFIVSESKIRRSCYAVAMDNLSSEIQELTQDLFELEASHQSQALDASFIASSAMNKKYGGLSPQSTDRAASRTITIPVSSIDKAQYEQMRSEPNYMPSLSPIASVSNSNNQDDNSSRGRTSSRWWEDDDGMGSQGSQANHFVRSKRESKYMGHLRNSLEWAELALTSQPRPQSPQYPLQNTDEHLPEKVGFHKMVPTAFSSGTASSHLLTREFALTSLASQAVTDPKPLDVSRLVTLPPPYPRHHPAINNNHPSLTPIRYQLRLLSDLTDIERIKETFLEVVRTDSMDRKTTFAYFQSNVVTPVDDILMKRINNSSVLAETLYSQISHLEDSETQEEGDSRPELLEQLTLSKWIFDATEILYREMYDILNERNERYREMIIRPYELTGNIAKADDAEAFFHADSRKRMLEFERGCVARATKLLDIVESSVRQGVEIQLSAFWDVTPALHMTISKVPRVLNDTFKIEIPSQELEENPGYAQWPLQYLWSLLEHGEKSMYQFIESQTNLLCLLHEVKGLVARAKGRLEDLETTDRVGESQVKWVRREERERMVTEDLKEKVRCIEEIWESALGGEFSKVKARVRQFLENRGGWEGVENLEI